MVKYPVWGLCIPFLAAWPSRCWHLGTGDRLSPRGGPPGVAPLNSPDGGRTDARTLTAGGTDWRWTHFPIDTAFYSFIANGPEVVFINFWDACFVNIEPHGPVFLKRQVHGNGALVWGPPFFPFALFWADVTFTKFFFNILIIGVLTSSCFIFEMHIYVLDHFF